ncbi:monosaccharide ABC transporter ATP-binding protein (CUT2 family) [Pseudonocardia autotrophica]|uniref:Xylose import ATP-binding protein XylG n=3 Tax=Pseudonocardiaceae TaxID=2070 RepID=A0A1Y2MUQ3_PSEAH|nr:Xylose import ATP-binding protein XylG [Pseudonocardia autotrophica]TDN76139.1 monosaccharide ABC transporter ATP-binding protein (CUT2 family) [Pseudonocardia autotrophica]BBG00120.1 xylose ABC transporter ATP-binding protein [Pseudonocardia autotrophica]GEC26085.1 xylose ABC transporter ATP-binding protein [Pseudonocardia saturnea]
MPDHEPSGGPPDTILEMRSITKTFPGVTALSEVSLAVRRGEIHAICGENGAGKSTLMKVLSGVHPAGSYEGEIVLDGRTARFSGIRDSESDGVVIIHQELALIPHLSIAENIFLGNERRGRFGLVDWARTHREAAQLLGEVGLEESPSTPVGRLGVGKQQLVEIVKAMAKDVRLLILDEPTAALNDTDSAHLLELLRRFRDSGITAIIISHKLDEIVQIADRTTVIRDGRSVETFTIADEPAPRNRIIRGMVGRDLASFYPERESRPGAEMLRISDWTVRHPTQDRTVVHSASLTVRAGEVVGIAGLMGAGRTELAMSVFGRSWGRDISGRLHVGGHEVEARTVDEAIRAGIAYVTEDRKHYGLNLVDDIRRNISAAGLPRLARGGWVDGDREHRIAEDYRRDLGIRTAGVTSGVSTLSGGNQQKVVLAKWLFTEPEVLILDEPTRGIDVGARYEIYVIVNRLVEAGKAVLVISSELPELLGICDRIYTLSAGRITGEVPVGEATQEGLMALMTEESESAA